MSQAEAEKEDNLQKKARLERMEEAQRVARALGGDLEEKWKPKLRTKNPSYRTMTGEEVAEQAAADKRAYEEKQAAEDAEKRKAKEEEAGKRKEELATVQQEQVQEERSPISPKQGPQQFKS
ncbi:hypothetical protein GOP47_0002229 [Adiantum capillus-veneris]|uniref:Uncharacterized protein n=1 Tax=Adiantum capillus-veneris TaxID=13818 RepID=A0A9D4V9S1_ADICA|nr:hypothetical protein GOP47_0002229 [Adiantum capillus-veneris]